PSAPPSRINNTNYPAGYRPIIQWYRIQSVGQDIASATGSDDDDSTGTWYRDATIVGTNWDVHDPNSLNNPNDTSAIKYDASNYSYPDFGNRPTAYATLFDGAISVYQKTI